ncbi:MAG: hypothetical protein HUU48_05165 [Flavobacteriales bacterium]|nr:hypothetical protein [Flavobacteriales bacterium]
MNNLKNEYYRILFFMNTEQLREENKKQMPDFRINYDTSIQVVYIDVTDFDCKNATCKIVDDKGNFVFSSITNKKTIEIPLEDFEKGFYVLSVENDLHKNSFQLNKI